MTQNKTSTWYNRKGDKTFQRKILSSKSHNEELPSAYDEFPPNTHNAPHDHTNKIK